MIDVADLLQHVANGLPRVSMGVRGGPNIGWGDGLIPFLMVGAPVLAFLLWYEWTRRRR